MPRLAIVHVHDPRVRWSVRASAVMRIAPATEWRAGAAIDVLASLGPMPVRGARAGRVMVVRGTGDREAALVLGGAIDVAEVDARDVLPLPAEVAGATPQISAIILAHDASLSLLVEPSIVTATDTEVGEELCPSRS